MRLVNYPGEVVQSVVNRLRVKYSPEKTGLAVTKKEGMKIECIVDHPKAKFGPDRRAGTIETMFRK